MVTNIPVYTTSELYHWGIKGMKWGVRRYQDENGRLTEAGLARYRDSKNIAKDKLRISDLHPDDAEKVMKFMNDELSWNKKLSELRPKSEDSFVKKMVQKWITGMVDNSIQKGLHQAKAEIDVEAESEKAKAKSKGATSGGIIGKYYGEEEVERLKKEKEEKERRDAEREEARRTSSERKEEARRVAKEKKEQRKEERKRRIAQYRSSRTRTSRLPDDAFYDERRETRTWNDEYRWDD